MASIQYFTHLMNYMRRQRSVTQLPAPYNSTTLHLGQHCEACSGRCNYYGWDSGRRVNHLQSSLGRWPPTTGPWTRAGYDSVLHRIVGCMGYVLSTDSRRHKEPEVRQLEAHPISWHLSRHTAIAIVTGT